MDQSKWFFHPIFIFVFSIIALGLSLFLYIYWYVKVSSGLHSLITRFNLGPDKVLESQTWVVIMVLSILVGIILLGIFTIFVYNQKTFQLYRLQNNFINNFTHELKTPVTSLKLYLETFLKHDLSRNDQTTYIQYMLADVNRLADNINSILNLAKIESKGFGEEFVRAELVQTVEQFCHDNRHLFKNCSITITNLTGQPVFYPIDKALFDMLLMNLLTNAVKYNQSGNPQISISFEKDFPKLFIRFSDNGIGLEKTVLKKIFKKFYQVGKSDNMSAMGSGLGLYLAQQIAKRHKGKITAHSEGIGKGSVFTLTLPERFRRSSP
ncbi:MAG: sensor histidine kinase [Thermodesulfobacteriota bacterium]